MEKKAFILSWVSIIVSVITLVVVFYKVTPNSIVDLGTFIGVVAAFIGICVTFSVGYQIYNAIEIRQKLTEIDRVKAQIKEANDNLEYLKSDTYDSMYTILATAVSSQSVKDVNAFYYMNMSLKYALDLNEQRKNYISRIRDIERYCLFLNTGNGVFHGSSEEMKQKVDTYKGFIQPVIDEIKKHPKYHIIADDYDRLVRAYEARMDKIRSGQAASITDIYDDLK